ncbi:MAG: hypothetical protein COV72_09265 [Candidatus Omnitrophica bacterium CG11_big_fil_rev_8_21_14_0_20_42_13]|uniref:Zinc finger DksA/TraR C4-type domain-containing protein n=1 Tax=Candidatus Ghiorseimicrobium undicola TaxID=1974746 RepID=A0A2H0LV65_9BACT|nr:MAG: hypothetical protein COV72_09265 [Candidatus Omnitrophica bacterium CG11_big_fil_rev_8_21_14_0_20_42_13]
MKKKVNKKITRKAKLKTKPRRMAKAKAKPVRRPKAPAKKKINKKELKFFKDLLLEKKDMILEGIAHVSEDTLKKSQKEAAGDISAYTYHMADVATDTYDREFSLGMGSSERQMLYEVNDALKKIEEATYGVCEDCANIIGKTRLKAMPQARLCLKCQQKTEEI